VAVAIAAALTVAASACGGGGAQPEAGAAPEGAAAGAGAGTERVACSGRAPEQPAGRPTFEQPPPREIDVRRSYRATLLTSCGRIVIALDARGAPNTVNNFVALARADFYDGLTFHRVVPGFVIQGGDPRGDGTGGPGYTFPDELPSDGYRVGSVAMANAGPDTNGSQFFIVVGAAGARLPPAFSRFGQVVAGMDVARRIAALADPSAPPGDPGAQVPRRRVYIDDVAIEER
jgi:cyclophilin family peptidyl-prolyl cis-trans isomerase